MDLNKHLVERIDDIIIEILIILPPKSLCRLKCVSKRWNNLITDPLFIKSYDSRRRLSNRSLLGFVQCNTRFLYWNGGTSLPWVSHHSFLSVGKDGHGGNFPAELGYFISASNGLFLCGCIPSTYHVGNPMTKKWVTLPPPPQRFAARSAGLSCEEYSNDYKVVVACSFRYHDQCDYIIPLETYSSVTGKWAISVISFACSFEIRRFLPPTVIEGVFHWFTVEGDVIVYDSSFSFHDEERGSYVQYWDLVVHNSYTEGKYADPLFIQAKFRAYSTVLWRTDNGQKLWSATNNNYAVQICYLPIGKYGNKRRINSDEWILVHEVGMYKLQKDLIHVTAEELAADNRLVAGLSLYDRAMLTNYIPRSYLSVVGVISCDLRQLLLVRLRERIFIYDYERYTMEPVVVEGYPSFTSYNCEWYPYIEAVSLSSYNFGFGKEQKQKQLTEAEDVLVQGRCAGASAGCSK